MYKNYIVNYKNAQSVVYMAYYGANLKKALKIYLDGLQSRADICELKIFKTTIDKKNDTRTTELTAKVNKFIDKLEAL